MKNVLKVLFTILMAALILNSCSKEKLDEIDLNPNSPTNVPLSLLMPQVTIDIPVGVSGIDLAWYSSVFVEHTAGAHAQLQAADNRLEINPTMGNNRWNDIYANVLHNLNNIIEKATDGDEPERWVHAGIAKVLFAYTLGVTTDIWGDVPYTEAWMGSENRKPKYDTQEFIYTQVLQQMLDEAIELLQRETIYNPANTDLIHGGDVDKWIKAAWGLKARFYQRMSNTTFYNADNVLSAVNNSFTGNSDEFVFSKFTTDATGQNPWYQESNLRKHHVVSQTLYDLMNNLNDPRVEKWFLPAINSGEINPGQNGETQQDQAGEIYSKFTPFMLNPTSPMPLMTYEELLFIKAEALLSKGDQNGANEAFLDAVTSALLKNEIPTDDVSSFTGQFGDVDLEEIIKQKYISFWVFQPIEAYNDYRRTGYPAMTNPNGPPPHRFPYAQNEYDSNAENVPLPPGQEFNVKVWWAK